MDSRDLAAAVLTGLGAILTATGVGLWAGPEAGITVAGGLTIALGLLLGWRPSSGSRRRRVAFERPRPLPGTREQKKAA